MKSTLLTLLSLLLCVGVMGQSNSLSLSVYSEPKYKDTLNCLVRLIDTVGYADRWVKAKVVFKDGLHNPTMRTTWSVAYAGMAIGPFNNEVIFDDKTIAKGIVIQVSIIDKKPTH